MKDRPTRNDILSAQARIAPHIRRTPLLHAENMNSTLGCQVYLKPEMLQITGAFKLRGALSKILTLTGEERSRGVITASSGNHAQGVAYAAGLLGMKALVIVAATAPAIKAANTRALGAEVILHGEDTAARWRRVYKLAEERGYIPIHSYEDPLVMAGQGTIGLEILEDLPAIDTVIVPMGGGGLISGISTAIKETAPGVRVIGAEPAATPKYYVSRQNGRPTTVPLGDTVADGLNLAVPGINPYPIIERYVDEIVTVDDAHIISGMRMLAGDAKLIAESAAAIGIGALLAGKIAVRRDEKICVVLSGGNWDLPQLAAVYA